jgi:hypothetical protein
VAGAVVLSVGLGAFGVLRETGHGPATAGTVTSPVPQPGVVAGGPAAATSSVTASPSPTPTAAAGALELGEQPFHWPSSVWDQTVGTAPVAANSDAEVADLIGQVSAVYGGIAALNVSAYNVSAVTAPPGQARVDVAWTNCQHKNYTPTGLLGPGGQFTGVPIPADAIPAAGTDSELTIWSPSTDQLWEFWQLHRTGTGWSACWGGRIDDVAKSPGYFTDGFGASATGLATVGGMVSIAEARRGVIDHALALAITNPAPWNDVSWPAQRSDGSPGSTGVIAEGTRFRLDPKVDVAALHLTPLAAAIARAAQTYGFIVSDKASAVSVVAQSGAVEQAQTGSNPWSSILGATKSYEALRGFPWQDLQALPADYGRD